MKQRKIICAILRLCTSLLVCLTVNAQTNPNQPDTAMLKDGQMHIVLCGTGSPLPDATRASACTAVIAGGEFVLIDTGPGSWRKAALSNLPTAALSAVLLTHFHSDHIGDLGETITMSWGNGRRQRLDVYGPPGVERVVAGCAQAYAQDVDSRVAHHGEQAMPRAAAGATAHAVTITKPDEAALVFERNGLKITAFSVAHDPARPAYGYRLEDRGRVVVITGDTAKSANVAKHAAGADLLIHDALAGDLLRLAADNFARNGDERRAKLSRDIMTYHASPLEAAETTAAAKVETLIFTPLVPPPVNQMIEQAFLRGVSNVFSGKVVIGKDGMRFDLSPRKQ
jgi:ribonuclease Z